MIDFGPVLKENRKGKRKMFGKRKDTVDIIDFKKEQKRRERKQALVNGWNSFAGFVRDNKDVLVPTTAAVVTVAATGTKIITKAISASASNKEIKFKENTIYDRSQGRYVALKRPLKPAEALELERRRKAGEGLNYILSDMGLLRG